ncbi:MAG: hypothetical protein GEU78_16850 [Actinobacteria bacterium]|nr:hypothetical protein [Actinomycetota bacterium]
MRATTVFNRLLDLDGVSVRDVDLDDPRKVVVTVALRRRRLACPLCDFTTRAAYEADRRVLSRWRHLDLAGRTLEVVAKLRRLVCPTHKVRVEAVPFARHRSEFTRDFDCLVAWLATKMDKTAIGRLVRVDWATLARRHLTPSGLVLYDLSGSWMEGRTCPLAGHGYSRDGRRGKAQICYGLVTDADDRPVAVNVFGDR